MRGLSAIFLAFLGGAAALRAQEAPPPRIVHTGLLEAKELDEVSGLAASRRRPDILWGLTDSANPPDLYAAGLDGSHKAVFAVVGVTNRDWEDIDSFDWNGQPCLLIADTGDNEAVHPESALHIVREPAVPPGLAAVRGAVPVLRTIRFVYEDGPRDVEAVAVDPGEGAIYLLSKRDHPPVLYSLPLADAATGGVLTARRVATVPHIPRPTAEDLAEDRKNGRFRSQVTALDFAPDGSAAAVLTYKSAYRFPRAAGESWADAFQRPPELLPIPRMRQAESLCYSADGKAIYITSEQRPCPLLRLEWAEP